MTEQFIGSWVELELQDGLKMKGIVQHIDINTKTMNMTNVTAYQNGQSFNALTCTVPGDKILNLEFSSENQSLGGKASENKGQASDNKPNANKKSSQPKQTHNNNKGAPPQARAYQNLDGSYVGIGTNNGNQNNSSKYGNQYQSSLDVNYDDQSLYKQTLSCEDVSDQENITLNQSSGYDYNYQKKEVKQSQNLYQQPRSYIQHENGYTNQSTGYYNQNDNYLHPPNQHRNSRNKHHHQNDKNIISDNNDSDYMSNDNRSNKHKNKGGFRKNRQNNHHSKHRSFGYGSEWASDDVSEYKEDFDFQSNLLLFDKKKVLEEIRANDTTAPGTLLVDINKKGQQPSYKDPHYHDDYQRLVKLRPDENVLSLDEREKAPGEFSDDDMLQPELNDLKISNSQLKTVTGVSCPTVSKEQMLEAVRLAVYEMGISEKQLIENGGFSISIMLLKAIGGARRLNPDNHNSCPVMVVLAGNNSTGAFSLCAAKHMSNHGVSVMTFIACKHEEMIESVAHQQAQLSTFGVKELSSISDLPSHLVSPVDIILDGLLGYEFMLHEVTVDHERVLIADLIDWANANKAPVLSLELASGACNTAAGTGFSPTTTTITPKWTLCLGATKEGLKDRNTSGEVFLADMGLPHCVWKQAGVKGWKPPFGHEFVQSLEFL